MSDRFKLVELLAQLVGMARAKELVSKLEQNLDLVDAWRREVDS